MMSPFGYIDGAMDIPDGYTDMLMELGSSLGYPSLTTPAPLSIEPNYHTYEHSEQYSESIPYNQHAVGTGASRIPTDETSRTQHYVGSRMQNASTDRIRNVGTSSIRNAGTDRIRNAGTSRIHNAGTGRIRNVGTSRIRNAGTGRIRNIGTSRIRNAGTGRIRNAGTSRIRNADTEMLPKYINSNQTSRVINKDSHYLHGHALLGVGLHKDALQRLELPPRLPADQNNRHIFSRIGHDQTSLSTAYPLAVNSFQISNVDPLSKLKINGSYVVSGMGNHNNDEHSAIRKSGLPNGVSQLDPSGAVNSRYLEGRGKEPTSTHIHRLSDKDPLSGLTLPGLMGQLKSHSNAVNGKVRIQRPKELAPNAVTGSPTQHSKADLSSDKQYLSNQQAERKVLKKNNSTNIPKEHAGITRVQTEPVYDSGGSFSRREDFDSKHYGQNNSHFNIKNDKKAIINDSIKDKNIRNFTRDNVDRSSNKTIHSVARETTTAATTATTTAATTTLSSITIAKTLSTKEPTRKNSAYNANPKLTWFNRFKSGMTRTRQTKIPAINRNRPPTNMSKKEKNQKPNLQAPLRVSNAQREQDTHLDEPATRKTGVTPSGISLLETVEKLKEQSMTNGSVLQNRKSILSFRPTKHTNKILTLPSRRDYVPGSVKNQSFKESLTTTTTTTIATTTTTRFQSTVSKSDYKDTLSTMVFPDFKPMEPPRDSTVQTNAKRHEFNSGIANSQRVEQRASIKRDIPVNSDGNRRTLPLFGRKRKKSKQGAPLLLSRVKHLLKDPMFLALLRSSHNVRFSS